MAEIPTIDEVEKLWDEYHVPLRIRKHMKQVAKVAVFMAKKLKEKGIHVDVGVVERAALLHDLVRSANFTHFDSKEDSEEDIDFWKYMHQKYGQTDHADLAADLIKEKYPEVAETIRAHSVNNKMDKDAQLTWEAKAFVYADCRVLHDKIVTIEERKADSRIRHKDFYDSYSNGQGEEMFKKMHDLDIKREKEIFSKLDISPEEVQKL